MTGMNASMDAARKKARTRKRALLLLAALPSTVLALLKIEWNPPRARLNEYDC